MKRAATAGLLSLLSVGVAALAAGCGDDDPGGGGGGGGTNASSSASATTTAVTTSAVSTTTASTTSSTSNGTGGAGGTGGGAPLTPEEALAATVAALCPGYAERYCEAAETTCGCGQAPGFPDARACLLSFEARCEAELSSYLSVVQAGQAVYHPEAAPLCFEAMEPLLAACLLIPNDIFFVACPILAPPGGFGPLPGEGEECDLPCAASLRCGQDGLCHTPGGEGDTCVFLPDCAPDLTCHLAKGGNEGTCGALDFTGQGDACTGPEECAGDTECLASVRRVCVEPEAGIACRYDTDCRATEYCDILDPQASPPSGTCTPAPGPGAACGNGVVCEAGLACIVDTGLCGAFPEEGEPCAAGPEGPFLCAAGLGCAQTLTCAPLPGLAEECLIGHPNCEDGLACAFENDGSFCREPVGDGGACANDPSCQEGLFCNFDEGRCRAHYDEGTPCSAGNECGPEGACLPDANFTFRCAPAPAAGETCFLDECVGDLRCKTPYTEGACVPGVLCGAMPF